MLLGTEDPHDLQPVTGSPGFSLTPHRQESRQRDRQKGIGAEPASPVVTAVTHPWMRDILLSTHPAQGPLGHRYVETMDSHDDVLSKDRASSGHHRTVLAVAEIKI